MRLIIDLLKKVKSIRKTCSLPSNTANWLFLTKFWQEIALQNACLQCLKMACQYCGFLLTYHQKWYFVFRFFFTAGPFGEEAWLDKYTCNTYLIYGLCIYVCVLIKACNDSAANSSYCVEFKVGTELYLKCCKVNTFWRLKLTQISVLQYNGFS